MIISYTILSIIIERFLEKTLNEKLLLAPLSVTNNVVLELITFGSPDFLNFLIAYFIGMGIQMFQRPYLSLAVDWLFDSIEEKWPRFKNQISKWARQEDELADKLEDPAVKKGIVHSLISCRYN